MPKKLKKSKSVKEAAQTDLWLAAVAASQERTTEQLQDKAVSKVSSALAIQTNKPANKSQPNTLMDFSFSSLSTLSSSSKKFERLRRVSGHERVSSLRSEKNLSG